jgi:catechol 2,3-dioxygenase-like lactoylglutathione lyase family enzyme
MAVATTIDIERVDHIGIRVVDVERALAFYKILGFETHQVVTYDPVTIIRNGVGVEINLIVNANDSNDDKNILMDVPDVKYPGYTHAALRVSSIGDTIRILGDNDIAITQGPVKFRDGQVSVFVRDPDLNVIELRGRDQDEGVIEGVEQYENVN